MKTTKTSAVDVNRKRWLSSNYNPSEGSATSQ